MDPRFNAYVEHLHAKMQALLSMLETGTTGSVGSLMVKRSSLK
jgi:hypothetical protein